MRILLVSFLLGTLSYRHQHAADAFSLQMSANNIAGSSDGIPPPFRAVANPPPTTSIRFNPPPKSVLSLRLASSATEVAQPLSTSSATKQGTLGLLTFDLDDSLNEVKIAYKFVNIVYKKLYSILRYFLS